MYVWEVRENGGYDGILWSVLIKDDEYALDKIKDVVIKDLECSSDREILAKQEIDVVQALVSIESYYKVEKFSTNIEVEKIEVL